jgi:hypothetical protein
MALQRLLDDVSLRQRLGAEGKVAYEAEFAEESFLDHYLAVANELLARRRRGLDPVERARRARPTSIAGRPVFFDPPDRPAAAAGQTR